MNTPEAAKRVYVSPLRTEQARATRLAVLRAAVRLFSEQGYVGTSIADIAREAGVSRATVSTAVGAKPALLKKSWDFAIADDDEPTPIPERPTTKSFREQPDQWSVLDAYAVHAAPITARVARLGEAVRAAAGTDPEAHAVWQEIQGQRHRAAFMVVDAVLAVGSLRDGLDRDRGADLIWILNDSALYFALVHQRGWSPQEFQRWQADTMKAQLLTERPT